jgi:LysM repeat protein
MAPRRRRSPLRVLAPLALVAFGVALIVVVSSSGVESDKGSAPPAQTTGQSGGSASQKTKAARRRSYTIKPGDTLGAIAQKTGVSVTKLEELNPALDPESLVAGQKIKLRE